MEGPKNEVGPGPEPSTRRRSKRNRSESNHDSKAPDIDNGTKKKKTSSKKTSTKKPAATAVVKTKENQSNQPTLLSLPDGVQLDLLQYLDVSTLLKLSQTCSYYHQLIQGTFLTNLSLPFEKDFLQELKESPSLEKKPMLRLESKKPTKLMWEFDPSAAVYILEYQMALLDLHKVREVHLVPTGIYDGIENSWRSSGDMELFKVIDLILLRQIASVGNLRNISRLDILILDLDLAQTVLGEFMPALTNLLEFTVQIAEPKIR